MFKRLTLTAILTLLGTIGLFLVGSFLLQHDNGNKTLAFYLQAHYWDLMYWRYLWIGILFIFWSKLITTVAYYKNWEEEKINFFIRCRWYLFGGIVLFEFFIANHVLAMFIQWIYQRVVG